MARKTGSVAAAATVLAGYEDLKAQPSPVPAGVRVAADAEDIDARDVEWAGPAGTLFGHLAMPRFPKDLYLPGVLVVHENRGLVEHIKDVTRRAARAGFIALSVDLLSRQGGVGQFADAAAQSAAYNRTVPLERLLDLISGLDYLKYHPSIVFDRIGIIGSCAGGQNVWDFIVNLPETAAAVPFTERRPRRRNREDSDAGAGDLRRARPLRRALEAAEVPDSLPVDRLSQHTQKVAAPDFLNLGLG